MASAIPARLPVPANVRRQLRYQPRRRRAGSVIGIAPTELVFLVEEAAEGGYTARALGEAIFTEADDLDQLRAMVRDAVACHFEDEARPRVVRLHLVHDELLAV